MTEKSTYRSIPIYFVGTVMQRLVGFIMLPIYTSYLTPTDYGVIGLLVMTISVFETALCARVGQALPKFYFRTDDADERASIISTALLLSTFVSLFTTALVWHQSAPISQLIFGDAKYAEFLAVYCVLLITVGIEAYGLTYLRIRNRAIFFVSVSLAKLIVQLGLNIYLVVYLEMGVMGVVYSAVFSSVFFAVLTAGYVAWQVGVGFSASFAKRMLIYSWPLWVAGLAMLYSSTANRYFIRIFADLADVGLFELAHKFAFILPLLIWSPFSSWWQTERFRLYEREDNGRSAYPVVFDGIATAVIGFGMVIILLAHPVIQLMSDPAYWSASTAVPYLVVSVMTSSLALFFNTAFLIKDRTIIITYIKWSYALFVTIGFVIFIPSHGFVGASVVMAVVNTVLFLFGRYYSVRYVDMGISLRYFSKIVALLAIISFASNVFTSETLLELFMIRGGLLIVGLSLLFVLMNTDREASVLTARVVDMLRFRRAGNRT